MLRERVCGRFKPLPLVGRGWGGDFIPLNTLPSRPPRGPGRHHLIPRRQVGRLNVLALINQPLSPKAPTPGWYNTSWLLERSSELYNLSTLVRSPEIWFDVPSSRMTMFLAIARPSTAGRIREKRGGGNQRGWPGPMSRKAGQGAW